MWLRDFRSGCARDRAYTCAYSWFSGIGFDQSVVLENTSATLAPRAGSARGPDFLELFVTATALRPWPKADWKSAEAPHPAAASEHRRNRHRTAIRDPKKQNGST